MVLGCQVVNSWVRRNKEAGTFENLPKQSYRVLSGAMFPEHSISNRDPKPETLIWDGLGFRKLRSPCYLALRPKS